MHGVPGSATVDRIAASDLAQCLRAWRDRADPAAHGLAGPARRRTPGLRREEVADRAGISVNYLMRLEQGRASTPSPSVVDALARALRLDDLQTAHLQRLAGHADRPTGDGVARELTPSVLRIVDRFRDVPVLVLDPAWTIVAANDLARAFLAADVGGQNAARNQFLGPRWVHREPEDDARFDRQIVGDLRLQLGRHPDDEPLRSIVAELRAGSPRFADLWSMAPAALPATSRKTFRHPTLGPIAVDCDVTEFVGSDLRLVVWTAEPGTRDAEALASLGAAARPA